VSELDARDSSEITVIGSDMTESLIAGIDEYLIQNYSIYLYTFYKA
jgi:hypothetical protein